MQAPLAGNTMATPRVNKATISNYVDCTVRLVGTVKEVNRNERIATLETSDKQTVTVRMQSIEYPSKVVEIVGTVNRDNSVTEIYAYAFGDNFDFDNYDQLINLTARYPEIFGLS